MSEDIKHVGLCYVLVQTPNIVHPIVEHRHDVVWYPERALTLIDCMNYRPFVKSIVTENPWLIACYDREHVRVWDVEHGWIRPNHQTYGASVNNITMTILKFSCTIPAQVLDGGEQLQKQINKLEETYKHES
jgi:hypothetical protein